MGELTIGVFSSLVGSTTLASAVKIAEAAMEKGHKVYFWISGNATTLAKKNQKKFQDYSFLQEKVLELIDKGMEFTICEACAQARGYHEGRLPRSHEAGGHGLVPRQGPRLGPHAAHRR